MAQKIDLIRQALSAAESSIKLARQLLSEIEGEGVRNKQKTRELPGVVGIFDGQKVVTEKGETHPVPENYASKSILVAGDTLKLVEQGKGKKFKQVEHVKRHKTMGILTKKDGKWAAVTSEGSYKLLPAAVDHFEGEAGDEVLVQLPANNLQTTWAAVEKIAKKGESESKVKTTPTKEKAKDEEKEEKPKVGEKRKKEEKQPKEEKPKEEKTRQPKQGPVASAQEKSQPQAQPVEKPKEVGSTAEAEDELT
jgi:hypothetical protein